MDIYIRILAKIISAANVALMVSSLEISVQTRMTPQDMKYETIDKFITKCMLKAGEKCRNLYMDGVPFSPELVPHLNSINFWRILIHKKKGSNTNMRTILRLQGRCGITGRPLDLDLQSMLLQYKQIIFDYRTFRKTAASTRTAFQDS